jgi:hypothetical protein
MDDNRANGSTDNEDIDKKPEKHEELIREMKVEAGLITNNSPYAEVRCVVDYRDDPLLPCSTIRAWVMGIMFSFAIAFINGFFEPRYPSINVASNVSQLLAYLLGKLCEKILSLTLALLYSASAIVLNLGRSTKRSTCSSL